MIIIIGLVFLALFLGMIVLFRRSSSKRKPPVLSQRVGHSGEPRPQEPRATGLN
jgi:hypothetical protein